MAEIRIADNVTAEIVDGGLIIREKLYTVASHRTHIIKLNEQSVSILLKTIKEGSEGKLVDEV